jgi:hypothetical protein
MRLLLDCSEAVRNDVGTGTEDLHEGEIIRRLKNIRIGYQTDTHDGKLRYRIVSDLTTEGFYDRLVRLDDTTGNRSVGVSEIDDTVLRGLLRLMIIFLNRLDEIDATVSKRFYEVDAALYERWILIRAGLYKATLPIETAISKKAEKFETVLDGTLPILGRIGDSRVHDRMNEWLERAIALWRSYLPSRRRRPTVKEAYEDVNWRF